MTLTIIITEFEGADDTVTKVAMVCVAAVALGSSTYAWFVTNNKVDATTSTISAQSNAAFMYIRNENNESKDLRSDVSTLDNTNTELYPAHWSLASESANYETAGKFYKAYAQEATASTRNQDTVAMITGTTGDAGSVEAAVASKYAVKNTFKVGSKGNDLTDLIVDASNGGISLVSGDNSNTQFDNALRILVKCGDNWVLCDKSSILGASNTSNKLADSVTSEETTIDIYVFYDGDDAAIYTNNLASLKDASKKIKVTFSATSDDK